MDDKNALQPNGAWVAPLILSPLDNSTVSPFGFNIVALAPALADSWKIECWGEATDHHGYEDEWVKLEHWVPDIAFDRFNAYFNFRVRYKQAWLWSDWAYCYNLHVPDLKPPRPTINLPPYPAAVKQALTITGVVAGNVTLQMSTDLHAPVVGSSTGSGNMRTFTPTTNWAAGLNWVKVVQTVGGLASDPSDLVSIGVRPSIPGIPAPPSPASARQILTITGVVTGNVTLQLSTEEGTPVEGGFTGSGATRTFTPTYDWAAGIRVKVVQFLDGVPSNPSNLVFIPVKPSRPVITPPPSPASVMQALEISGVVAGNIALQMHTEDDSLVDGAFIGGGNIRSFTPSLRWDAGTTRVNVVQTVNGVASDPSDFVSIEVKPSRPAITPPVNPGPARQILTITGVVAGNVTLKISTEADEPVDGNFSGNGSTRNFTPTADWVPGRVKVVQTVGGVDSDPSDLVSIVVKPPRLVITPPPSPPEIKQALTITGVVTGNDMLNLYNQKDATVGGFFTGSGSTRTFMPTSNWVAGTGVKAVQTVDGVASDPSDIEYIGARPEKLTIEYPPIPASPRQKLTFTRLMEFATVQVATEEGDTVEGHFTGGVYASFTPTSDWPAGATGLKARQFVGGMPSYWSNLVSIRVKPSKPAITLPPDPSMPNQALTITGVVAGNVNLRLYTEKDVTVAGDFTGSGSTRTFTPTLDWAPGINRVKVVQIIDLMGSDPSDHISFSAKPSRPAITPPPSPASAIQALTVTGVVAGVVMLQMSTERDAPVIGSFTGSGSTRTFTPTANWAAGTTQVKVVQTVNGVVSDPSDLVTVSVKPSKPVIVPPPDPAASNQVLTITGVATGTVILEMFDAADVAVAGSFTSSGGTRTFTPTANWAAGATQVKVVQTVNGVVSDPSDLVTVSVKPSKPVIAPPPDPAASNQVLIITGVATGTVTLQMFTETDDNVLGDFAVNGAGCVFTPQSDWGPGENTVKVIQTVNGMDSDYSDLCTFTVEVGEKPESPVILEPQRGGRTSRYPTIKIAGLQGALISVRLKDSDVLYENIADASGNLVFTVINPLEPGEIDLQVMQALDGPGSDWSAGHSFTVKPPPKPPIFLVPSPGGNTLRKPQIRGKGETGGEIVLCHANEAETPIDSVAGSVDWRWKAKEEWPVASYSVRAQQRVDGDCSEWTEPLAFYVVDSKYAIGDAAPVIGTPVMGTGQSVLLRVQVIDGVIAEAAQGITVEWRLNGEEEILASTETDVQGWTQYRYTPATVGKSEVLADITRQNDDVVMTARYEVMTALHDEWTKEAGLYLDGERVDLAVSDLMLLRRNLPYKLELKANDNSTLIGTTVILQDFWDASERGLTFVPDLGTPQTIMPGASIRWDISTKECSTGVFGLSVVSALLPGWQLPGRVEGGNMTDDVEIDLDSFTQTFGGDPAYPCLGAAHIINVKAKPDSRFLGQKVTFELSAEALGLGVTVSPSTAQTLGAEGACWLLDCKNSSQAGGFSAWLRVPAWDFDSLKLPMSLGHNKVRIAKWFGPREVAFPPGNMEYGILVESTFTERAAAGVLVTTTYDGRPPLSGNTQSDGRFSVFYTDGQNPRFSILNRYDGTTV
ncbi:hypothetical protein ACFZAC_12775 [Pseudomonas fluorescens]|uniref:hypothetical protein n=1 Tax=Pseudomonas fluorescens TaxID=294 RepID=UPI003747FE7C